MAPYLLKWNQEFLNWNCRPDQSLRSWVKRIFLLIVSHKKDKLYDQSFYDKALYFSGFVVCQPNPFWHIKKGLKLTLCLQCTHLRRFDFSRKKGDWCSKQMVRKDQPLSCREEFKAGMKILLFHYFFTNRKSFGIFASWQGANIPIMISYFPMCSWKWMFFS